MYDVYVRTGEDKHPTVVKGGNCFGVKCFMAFIRLDEENNNDIQALTEYAMDFKQLSLGITAIQVETLENTKDPFMYIEGSDEEKVKGAFAVLRENRDKFREYWRNRSQHG